MAQLAIDHGLASSLANIRERDRVDASIENACVEALCPSYMNGHGTCSLNRSGLIKGPYNPAVTHTVYSKTRTEYQ